MASTIGILIFDGTEELDFVGPWEVFTASNEIRNHLKDATPKDHVFTVSQNGGTVKCAKGMRVIADHSFADCPPIDVLRRAADPRWSGYAARGGKSRDAAMDCANRSKMHMGDQRMHRIAVADRGRTG